MALLFFTYSQRSACAPVAVLKARNCQSTSPEMFCCSLPSIRKRRRSFAGSLETFHQKLTVVRPVTVVWNHADALCASTGLRAASTPSCVTAPLPIHVAAPFVVHGRPAVSSARARLRFVKTASVAIELGTVPTALLTMTR